jgi:hypothetical protein
MIFDISARAVSSPAVAQTGEWFIATFRSSVSLLLPLCFIAFFIVTAVALVFHRHRYVKRTYVAGFLAVFMITNLVGLPVLPMMHWHKFSEPRPETQSQYHIRLVDAEGDELPYPVEATLSVDSVSFSALTTKMRTGYSTEKNERIARYLLERARSHRQGVNNRTLLRYLRFPPHGLLEAWNREMLQSHSQLVGIRLYRINLTTSADGTEVLSRSETFLKEFYPGCARAQSDEQTTGTVQCEFRPIAQGGMG